MSQTYLSSKDLFVSRLFVFRGYTITKLFGKRLIDTILCRLTFSRYETVSIIGIF